MTYPLHRRWADLLASIGCHADGLQTALLGVLIANLFVSFAAKTWNTGTYDYAEFVVFFVAYGYLYKARMQHARSLCLNCSQRFPLNLSEEAERQRVWLKLAHIQETPLRFVLSAVLFVIPVVGILDRGLAKAMLYTLFTFLFCGVLVFGRARRLHNMLQPYCPFCRHNPGDGPIIEVVPDGPPGTKLPTPV